MCWFSSRPNYHPQCNMWCDFSGYYVVQEDIYNTQIYISKSIVLYPFSSFHSTAQHDMLYWWKLPHRGTKYTNINRHISTFIPQVCGCCSPPARNRKKIEKKKALLTTSSVATLWIQIRNIGIVYGYKVDKKKKIEHRNKKKEWKKKTEKFWVPY